MKVTIEKIVLGNGLFKLVVTTENNVELVCYSYERLDYILSK